MTAVLTKSQSGSIPVRKKEVLEMKSKVLRIALLAVAIIICLSVGLYAAHSFSQAKASNAASLTATDNAGGPHIVYPTQETDRRLLRKAK